MDHFARALIRCDGNHPHDLCEGFDQRVFVGTSEHQKPDGTIEGGDEQHGVSHGDVIGGQQRTATRRHVFPPLGVQAVERVGRNPQQQSQQGIGEQIEDIHRGRERHGCGPEEERRQSHMQIVRKSGINGGCADDPDKREKIGECNDAAFVVFLGPALN